MLWRALAVGFVRGARFALETRVPHAVVLALLSGRGSGLGARVRFVVQASSEHAMRLGLAAGVYRVVLVLLVCARAQGVCVPRALDALVGGLAAGLVAFGSRTMVDEQVRTARGGE